MEYISFEHNNIAAELVKQAYDTPPLAFVHSYGCQQNVNDGERIKGVLMDIGYRSEERRVGKECRSRWSPYH